MIELTNIKKTYGGTVKAVDDLNLTISSGEIFGFLGPNGAGKTTTIKMITGILNADSGSIKVNGTDIGDNALKVKKQLGFVPDTPNMFLRLKGIEYLNFMADIYDVPSDIRKERAESLGKRFGMLDVLDDRIQSYSHGMRQKIVIMGVLIHYPPVWILDEPMTGLDPSSSFKLKKMMREHADKGNTVFFSTHVLDVAEKICDRVAIINKGKILFCGTMDGDEPVGKKVVGYCRVSSKQKDELERQIENVKTYMIARGYSFNIITDIGSGINYNRKGLNQLIDMVVAAEVEKIVVLYKDRLLRFGYELIENLCSKYGITIEIIDNTEKTGEQEHPRPVQHAVK